MNNLPISETELIHAELEAKKNSVVMLKICPRGKVSNRILVYKKDIELFKSQGYAENIKDQYDPQIGHLIDPKHIHLHEKHITFLEGLKEELKLAEVKILKKLTFWQKIKRFYNRLLGKKNHGRE